MKEREKYGLALVTIGVAIVLAGLYFNKTEGTVAGVPVMALGFVLLYLSVRKWYCAQCGQFLGKGDQPSGCERCGSNRVTTDDPGAGEAVRVRHE